MNEQKQIARDATFQIACAVEHLAWMRGVLHVLEDRLRQGCDEHYAAVANLAIYNADDWHSQLDCERESLERRTDAVFAEAGAAPHSVSDENVARTSKEARP
ncbi:hypothetical protein [Pseudomonas sp. OV226]|uniref:hypothetical protein n=1 Tax=Pseudomonas sp. OV226 TaxID=2135588 RepID=UPI000D6CCA00|nr:hypothetical protein [Pseudomonas sp. OV226]PWK31786.1 hypothetical protein C7534_12245 [Pseudomonas sp. OV226]